MEFKIKHLFFVLVSFFLCISLFAQRTKGSSYKQLSFEQKARKKKVDSLVMSSDITNEIIYKEDNSPANHLSNRINSLISETSIIIGTTENFKVSVVVITDETKSEKMSVVRIFGNALNDREYFIDKIELADLIKLFETFVGGDLQTTKYKCKSNIRFLITKTGDGWYHSIFNMPVSDCENCYTWQIIPVLEIENLTSIFKKAFAKL